PVPVQAADGRIFYATGRGDVAISLPNGSSTTDVTLKDTLYAKKMPATLISISRMDNSGYATLTRGG
ncbi:hypothetical protein SCHPADRAFT_815715, partial [Schizopora paradoxa]